MTEPRWCVGCHDPFGRDRALTLLVEDDHVLLVPPPGAAAVFSAQETRSLDGVLAEVSARVGTP